MLRIFRLSTKIINNTPIKKFSTNQKIINSINNSVKILPKLTPLEQFVKIAINTILSPFGIRTIKPNHILTYFTFGKYDGYRTSGLKWIPPYSTHKEIYCGDMTLTHNNMHLTDSNSNPIIVSSYVIYNIINPVNNIINLDSKDVLSNWIENNVREVISSYSYTELTGKKENIISQLVNKLNSDLKSEFYGIEIQKAGLLELNYAPEIAETMLIKQKAIATIEARKELSDATIHLIENISQKLDNKLSTEDKSKLITYLTVSMIGNNSPSHVINLN